MSTCRNSCCGCLRPPCGGTDATVPSMIFSKACCTPSPDTSRVIDGLSDLRVILSTRQYRRCRAGRGRHCIRRLKQLQNNVFNVFAHITRFGQSGRIGHRERHIKMRARVCASNVLPHPVGPISMNIGLRQFNSIFGVVQALVVVVNRNRQHALCMALPDHIVIQHVQISVGVGTPSRAFNQRVLFLHG